MVMPPLFKRLVFVVMGATMVIMPVGVVVEEDQAN